MWLVLASTRNNINHLPCVDNKQNKTKHKTKTVNCDRSPGSHGLGGSGDGKKSGLGSENGRKRTEKPGRLR